MLGLLFAAVLAQGAQTGVLGSDAVLQRMRVPYGASDEPVLAFGRRSEEFARKSSQMTVAKAADGWLKLLREWQEGQEKWPGGSTNGNQMERGPELVLRGLPRPEAWPLIRAGIDKLPEDKVRTKFALLFDRFLGNDAAVLKRCAAIRAKKEAKFPGFPDDVGRVELPSALRLRDAAAVARILAPKKGDSMAIFFGGIPDVVSSFGVAGARPILKQLLENSSESIYQFHGEATQRLARQVMLSDLGHVKTIQWSLIDKPEDRAARIQVFRHLGLPLPPGLGGFEELLLGGRFEEAVKVARSKEFENYGSIDRPELTQDQRAALFEALSRLLRGNPTLPLWDDLLKLSLEFGQLPQARALLDEAITAGGAQGETKRALFERQGQFAAAAGDVGGAVSAYRHAAETSGKQGEGSNDVEKLLVLFEATQSEGAMQAILGLGFQEHGVDYFAADGVLRLMRAGRVAEAQDLLMHIAESPEPFGDSQKIATLPVLMTEAYFRANRPQDIVQFIDGYSKWSAHDLAEVVSLREDAYYTAAYRGRPLGFFAGWAFARTGQKSLAIHTLRQTVAADMTQDESYELLNELGDASSAALYDRLAKIDPYEPRPVAWKADLLRRVGKLEEAEKLARKAIAMDPTDGDAPAGRRLTSYSILAQILRARGKSTEAERYERIVKAVRLGEQGDLYKEAGLLPQAREAYQQAATEFADAYCIQMRLGISLADSGRPQEALTHFERAYELLPGSFGEVESLCTGCEASFGSADRRKTARRVFEPMAAQMPSDPRVRYLLGQIEEYSGDMSGAAKSYRLAVRLDPRYLNAWVRLVGVLPKGEERRNAQLTVLRLDPMSRHDTYSAVSDLDDFAARWRVYDSAWRALPAVPGGPLYPLRSEPPKNMLGVFSVSAPFTRSLADEPLWRGPGTALARTNAVNEILGLMIED